MANAPVVEANLDDDVSPLGQRKRPAVGGYTETRKLQATSTDARSERSSDGMRGLASVTFSRIPPSTPSSFILTSFQLLDNILPRNAGFTGVRDVVCFSLYIGLNKQEDERRRY